MVLTTTSYTLVWTSSVHSSSGTLSDLIPWIYLSLPLYNHKGIDLGHTWMLLLLLSCFSRVRLCVTPQTAAHQAPPSLGFSRQEHWSGCHFLLKCLKVKSKSEVAQLCLTLSDPKDCSLPGSSIHGIFQARGLEWGAIAFSAYLNGLVFSPTFINLSLNFAIRCSWPKPQSAPGLGFTHCTELLHLWLQRI